MTSTESRNDVDTSVTLVGKDTIRHSQIFWRRGLHMASLPHSTMARDAEIGRM